MWRAVERHLREEGELETLDIAANKYKGKNEGKKEKARNRYEPRLFAMRPVIVHIDCKLQCERDHFHHGNNSFTKRSLHTCLIIINGC